MYVVFQKTLRIFQLRLTALNKKAYILTAINRLH